MEAKDARAEMFKDEAGSQIEELEQVIKDMKEEGMCYTDDIRRLADELDEIGIISQRGDTVEEEDLDEGEETV
jgi:hypothetical protein